jgi:uncharacterized membrane protein
MEVHRLNLIAIDHRMRFTVSITAIPILGFPLAYLLYFVKDRAWVLIASVLFLFMGGLLRLPLRSEGNSDYSVAAAMVSMGGLIQICWMAVILFTPLPQLTRRLGFVVLGVLTLLALSEISKLNLHRYLQAPKVSENSLPRAAQISLCGIRCLLDRVEFRTKLGQRRDVRNNCGIRSLEGTAIEHYSTWSS